VSSYTGKQEIKSLRQDLWDSLSDPLSSVQLPATLHWQLPQQDRDPLLNLPKCSWLNETSKWTNSKSYGKENLTKMLLSQPINIRPPMKRLYLLERSHAPQNDD
jgi:hypothetical protein